MDLDEDKEKINRHGCDDYREMNKIRPADHYQELKMNSDDKQHQAEEEEKINRPDQDDHKKIRPAVDDDEDEEAQDEADDDKNAAPSEIQTLRIKIKLPKGEPQQCACTTCGKVFSSRKAWGGHWKIHLKEEKEKENLKKIRNTQLMFKKLQDSMSNGGGGGGGCRFINAGDPICSICDREFKSWKSLFGHMRSHPDRGWKGIRPPVRQSGTAASAPPSPNATTTTSDVVGYVDLSRDLVGWAQTGKRGRPSSYCAASSLMNLAYSNPTLRIINNGARIQESASKRNKITISDSKAYFKSRDLKIVGRDESRTVQEFKCSSCSRSFASFQALGGHRSFHSKEKTSDTNVVESSPDVVDSEAEEEDENIANDSEETEEAHQCDVCDKSFSSGQALGGHKRCHWKGQTDQVASSSGEENQVVSNLVANEPGNRKILDFDLNELPDMDDKEEE